MKKMLAALALALTLPTCALGDSEGVIVQSSCNIVQSGDYYLAYCFAQVHNNASTVICLDQGTFDLQSGETLLSTSEVSQIWPYFLSPGEDGAQSAADDVRHHGGVFHDFQAEYPEFPDLLPERFADFFV